MPFLRTEDYGNEEIWIIFRGQRLRTQDSYYRAAFAVERDGFPNEIRVPAKAALPQAVGQHHNLVVAANLVFLGQKSTADQRLLPEKSKVIRAYPQPTDSLRLPGSGEIGRPTA